MTSFVHIEYPTQHAGVSRFEAAFDAAQSMRRGFSAAQGLAALLLSAIAAAALVVAYNVMDSVAEGHLMVMWLAMWFVAFAILATFAGAARPVALRLKAGLDGWSRSLALARADERMWALAKSDSRVMADLQTAQTRDEEFSAAPVASSTIEPVAVANVAIRRVRARSVLRAYQRNYI